MKKIRTKKLAENEICKVARFCIKTSAGLISPGKKLAEKVCRKKFARFWDKTPVSRIALGKELAEKFLKKKSLQKSATPYSIWLCRHQKLYTQCYI